MKDIASGTVSIENEADAKKVLNRDLLAMDATLDKLKADIETRVSKSDPFLTRRLNALVRKIDKFEASVTLVGQGQSQDPRVFQVL